ncbi:hypothetical protein COOONC_22406 [Cooperia oncophora]
MITYLSILYNSPLSHPLNLPQLIIRNNGNGPDNTPMPSTAPPSLYEPDDDQGSFSSYEDSPGPSPNNSSFYDPLPGPSSSSHLYDVPAVPEQNTDHFNKLAEELLSTEERYLGDLLLAKKLFHDTLITLPYRHEVTIIFRHWDQLIDVSRKIYLGLKNCTSPGHQQRPWDALNKLLSHPDAQKLYTKCTSSVAARGMSLSTYPLLIEKILKESNPKGELHQELDTALQLLRALVSEVNHAVTEEENVFLLRWAQLHVKCHPSLPLDFTSDTRLLGMRLFLHSGVLYKQRSGRLLVGILFNDFLLLTTPDGHLSKVS